MKNKETGEFELLVGNGQIISGFFILALLLAVFFALGFIVARAKYQQEPSVTTAMASSPSADTRSPAAAPVTPPLAPPPDTAANPPADSAAKPLTQAEQDTKATKDAETPAQPPAADTVQGTFWQVSCINPEAAKALQQTIKDMGLPASFSQAATCTRVLVGPYSDTANMARVKTQLENAGFHPVKHAQ